MQARPFIKERNYVNLIDERIINSHDVHQLFWMVRLAEKCLSREPKRRLNMIQVDYNFENCLRFIVLYYL